MANGKIGWWAGMVVLAASGAPSSQGQSTVTLIGVDTQVVLKARETELRVEKRVVTTGEVHRVYKVEKVEGDWLWVAADGLGGWVRAADVIPLDQAAEHFTNEIRQRPQIPWPYLMRGMIHYDKGAYALALADYSEAIKLDPKNAVAYHDRGDAWLAKKEYEKAIADYDEATKYDPKYAASYANRAVARASLGDHDLAIADDNEAIRLDRNDVAKYHHRAVCWTAKREYDRAAADYTEAIKLDPNDAAAYNGRAWVWATASDPKIRAGKKAVQSATRACEITKWKDPYCLGTLAAAEAEAGHFDAAVRWQEKAVLLFGKSGRDGEGHQRRLALYQAKKPYRDEVEKR